MCRFISPDAISYLEPDTINGLNLYAYCKNNPINYSDPTGHSIVLAAVIIGAVIGGIYGGISAAPIATNGWDIFFGVVIGAGVGAATGGIFEGASLAVAMVVSFTAAAVGDVFTQLWVEDKSFSEINLVSPLLAGTGNMTLGAIGWGVGEAASASFMPLYEYTVFNSIISSPSLAMGMTINMGISEYAPTYTIGELFDDVADFFKKTKKGK